MYESFYKLDGKPFRLTPDPQMLFPSKGHKRALSYLMYGFDQAEGFVMITGAVGTGKTLLIQTVLEQVARRDIAVGSIASANLDGDDILPAVASEFQIPYEGRSKEALLREVTAHFTQLSARGMHALLVVDEAQTLTPAALEMLRILSNLELHGRALLQVFLVGQNDLRDVIVRNRLEQLRQRVIASYRLEPMEADETRAYILHRLRAVGWNNDPVLAPEVFGEVHRAGRGIPRKLNLIMDRLLLYGYLEELHTLDGAAVATVLAELRDEMAGVPATLEASPRQPRRAPAIAPAPAAAPRPSPREAELLELEIKRNKILLQLMREENRMKQITQGDPAADAEVDHARDHSGARRREAGE